MHLSVDAAARLQPRHGASVEALQICDPADQLLMRNNQTRIFVSMPPQDATAGVISSLAVRRLWCRTENSRSQWVAI